MGMYRRKDYIQRPGRGHVVLASNISSQNKFRAYKTTTVNGYPDSYPSEFTLYKEEARYIRRRGSSATGDSSGGRCGFPEQKSH